MGLTPNALLLELGQGEPWGESKAVKAGMVFFAGLEVSAVSDEAAE